MHETFNDPGFLKRFRKRLDTRAQAELTKRVEGYRAEGLLPAKPKAMTTATEIEQLVKQLMDEKSITKQQAMKELFAKHPSLRTAWIREANRNRS